MEEIEFNLSEKKFCNCNHKSLYSDDISCIQTWIDTDRIRNQKLVHKGTGKEITTADCDICGKQLHPQTIKKLDKQEGVWCSCCKNWKQQDGILYNEELRIKICDDCVGTDKAERFIKEQEETTIQVVI